jgi:hypothetical protein
MTRVPKHSPSVNSPKPPDRGEQEQVTPPTPDTGDAAFPFGANADAARLEATPSTHGDAPTAAPDPFDPASLRLSHDFAALGVKKALLTVPVRKPDKSWWVRVHTSNDYALQTAVIELKEERETYLVVPGLWPALAAEATFSPRALFTAVNRQGVLFLWPIRLPGADGKADAWSQSALEAAQKARKGWVRVAANLSLGAYDVWEAPGELGEPAWPDEPFRELLATAFKGKLIDSRDHPVLRRLRGEA